MCEAEDGYNMGDGHFGQPQPLLKIGTTVTPEINITK
jgi:hypothetical protein